MKVVFDTSCIIILSRIKQLDIINRPHEEVACEDIHNYDPHWFITKPL